MKVIGSPYLEFYMNSDTSPKKAYLSAGDDSDELEFTDTVQAGDDDSDGILMNAGTVLN